MALLTLTRGPFASLFASLTRGRAAIFFLHRFAEPGSGILAHDPALLRSTLAALRARRFSLLPLRSVLDQLAERRPLKQAVAFTVDDGYGDFHDVAAPIFAEFDCPVTVFLTTGFLDGQLWLWWDRLAYAFEQTTRRSASLDLGEGARSYAWDGPEQRLRCRLEIVELLKRMPHESAAAAALRVVDQLMVEIPVSPPPLYAPMTWDAVRADARRGVTYGPHTVTHPILSRVDARQSSREIEESWNRVRAETDACVPVFCYPNGDPGSFGEREIAEVRRLGLLAALTASRGYATAAHFGADSPDARYAIPRFPYHDSPPHTVKIVSGLEIAAAAVRRKRP